ncbi:MAG: gas vesicle protein GvpO [Candidatus Aerophobetes bacterium]|nr:gas vesicle protein GvpO [Candidatus Aerophobetes bacterium]
MKTSEVAEVAQKELAKLIKLEPSGIKGVSKDEEGWHVMVEMIEKKSIPDAMDLLALYEVILDDEGNVLKFKRGVLRKRLDTGEEE